MDLTNRPCTDVDSIFLGNKDVMDYIRMKGWLKEKAPCIYGQCEGEMKLYKKSKYLNGYCYKCKVCGKEKGVFSGLKIGVPNIKLCVYFRCVYKWCENLTEKMY